MRIPSAASAAASSPVLADSSSDALRYISILAALCTSTTLVSRCSFRYSSPNSSPAGNASSTLYVVDVKSFQVVTSMSIDSYPVGLEVSKDGRYVFTTSQGRSNGGGNCVDIFEVNRKN